MRLNLRLALLMLAIGALPGCSYLKLPETHRVSVQQGNIITQDMVDQLRPGMTRSQVRFILGTPLIADTFTPDRWDYFYSLKRPNRKELRERLSVQFVNDKLAGLTGDYMPNPAPAANAAAGPAQANPATEEDLPLPPEAVPPSDEIKAVPVPN